MIAEARWIDLGDNTAYAEPTVALLQTSASGVLLEMNVPGIEAEEVVTDLGPFTKLRIPGSYFSIKVRVPMLPVIRRYIEIPQGATPRLSIRSADYTEVARWELGIGHRIHPSTSTIRWRGILRRTGPEQSVNFAMPDESPAGPPKWPRGCLARSPNSPRIGGEVSAHPCGPQGPAKHRN